MAAENLFEVHYIYRTDYRAFAWPPQVSKDLQFIINEML